MGGSGRSDTWHRDWQLGFTSLTEFRAQQESYDFFTRCRWLDRYRAVTLMSLSAISYREMALINIAFAYSQIGDGGKAKEHYERALDDFPNSGMASAALKLINSVERSNLTSKEAP